MKGGTYLLDHICERPGCSALSPTARTCGNSCRAKVWKAEHGYRDKRSVRNVSHRPQRRRETRYAIVQSEGSRLDVLALDTAPSKRAVEGAFGIRDRQDLFAIAASHLPAVA